MSIQRHCPPTKVVRRDLSAEANVLKAAADPHRLRILATLTRAKDDVCVCDFTDGLPLNQPTVSHHLRILREAGLVRCERRGTWVHYRLAEDAQDSLRRALDVVCNKRIPT